MIIRRAFTAIELMIAISLMLILAGLSVRGIFDNLRSSAVQQNTALVERLVATARGMAREADSARLGNLRPRDPDKRYGVVFVEDPASGRCWGAVTYGTSAAPANVLLGSNGQPVMRIELPPVLAFYADGTGTSWDRLASAPGAGAQLGVMFQYGTGYPTATVAVDPRPTFLGIAAADIAAAQVGNPRMIRERFAIGSVDRTLGSAIYLDASGRLSTSSVDLRSP